MNNLTSVREPANADSRRSFLRQSFSGGLLAAGLGTLLLRPTTARADTHPSDLDILNFALTLEHLEAQFYIEGLNRFSARDFRSGRRVSQLGPKTVGRLHDNLRLVRDHEVEHVVVLQQVITSLGGTPVDACQYNFGYQDPDGFLLVAQALENTGVMAYTGAIAGIENAGLQTAGATIATVEARHAAYLNLINGDSPFPEAFDTPKTMDEILAIAGQFIVSCP
jgi:rubrerythrin